MRSKILVVSLAVATMVTMGASYAVDLSAVKKPTPTVNKPAAASTSKSGGMLAGLTPAGVKGTIATINSDLVVADKSVQAAFGSLVSAVSSKEEAAKIKAQLNTINTNKNLSAAEKSAKIAEVMTNYGTALGEQKEKLAADLSSANDAKKQELVNAILELSDASLQYMTIYKSCMGVVSKVGMNPTLAVSLASEVGELKNTASILKNNTKSVGSVLKQSTALAKSAGITIPKKSKASKTSKVAI